MQSLFLKPKEHPYFKRIYTEFLQLKVGVVKIAFYDKKGHSLLRNGHRTTFTPAASMGHTYEACKATPIIFNTYQGVQFIANAFTDTLQAAGVAMSMDSVGIAIDNIYIERFWRSVKY